MMRIGFFSFLALFSIAASAEYNIENEVQLITQLLTDQSSVLVENSVSITESDEGELIFATFSIEGFHGGNNFQQFLIVFSPEYKTEDSPPFHSFGEPKIRLVGIRHLCPSPTEFYRHNSLEIKDRTVTGVCDTYDSETDFSVEVSPYDVEILYQ